MPSYHAYGFSVRLHAWDSQQQPPTLDDRLVALDPSVGHALEEVSEEYFEGQKGLQWLGDAPFYLVNAGRDLFLRQPQSLDECKDVAGPDTKKQQQSIVANNASLAPYTPSKPKSTAGLPSNDSPSNDTDSPLSSVPTDFDSSPPGPSTAAAIDLKSIPVRAEGAPRGWLHKPKQSVQTKNAFTKPLKTPIPIKVQCEFDRKAFPRSLNSLDLMDFCINIFYNGEFVLSRSYRAETVRAATAAEKQPNFAGRRLQGNTEAPFMALPVFDGARKHARLGGTDFVEQWNKINELLLTEADEWGRAGKYNMFRSPIGEYLEELSKFPIPEGMSKRCEGGRNIGVIDVVVALGKTLVLPNSLALAQPMRRLPVAFHGAERKLAVAPEELMSELRKRLMEQLHEGPPRVIHNKDDEGNNAVHNHRNRTGSKGKLPPRHRVPTMKSFMNQMSTQSDEGYHIEEIPKSGPRSRRILAGQSFPTNGEPPTSSRQPIQLGGGQTKIRSETMTSMASTSNLGSSSGVPRKRTREPSFNTEQSPPKRRKSTMVIEVPSYTPERSSDAITPEKHSGTQKDVRHSPRPSRQRTRKIPFEEMSPTPSTSSKVRNSKENQIPTSNSAPEESPARRTRSRATTEKSSSPPPGNKKNYNAKTFFGMDGICDTPFDFNFGLDGSFSNRSRPSTNFKGKAKKKAAPETPNSVGSMFDNSNASSNMTTNFATNPRSRSKTPSTQSRRRDPSSATGEPQADDSLTLPSLPSTEDKPKQSKPAIGKAELRGLLGSQLPGDEIHPALGSSFMESTINRPSRKGKRNDQNPVTSNKQVASVNRLNTYLQKGRLMIVKGLTSSDWDMIHNLPVTKSRRKISATSGPEGLATSQSTSIKKMREEHSDPLQASINFKSAEAGRRIASSTTPGSNSHQIGEDLLQNAVKATHRLQKKDSEETYDDKSPTANASNEFGMNLRNPRRSVSVAPTATHVQVSSNMDQTLNSSTTPRHVIETPIRPPLTIASRRESLPKAPKSSENSALEQSSDATLQKATSGNEPSLPSARRKPNLVIQTGNTNLGTQSGMSSPLTNRSYVQSKEGRKAPTPKSGTFPDLKKTPTTPWDDSLGFRHSFAPPAQTSTQISRQIEMLRARSLSDAEMLPPPPISNTTPEENTVVTRSSRSRPAVMSSPTPAMGPPPKTMSSTKASPEKQWPSVLNQGDSAKKDLTTPPILPPPKPYATRMSEATHSLRSGRTMNYDPDSSQSLTLEDSVDASTAQASRPPRPAPTPTPAPTNSRQTRPRPAASASMPPPPVFPAMPLPRPWTPNNICKDSVLSFATKEQIGKWFRLTHDEKQGHVVRPTRGEREGVFRAQSILMGVRYVLGADFEKFTEPTEINVKEKGEVDLKGKGKEIVIDGEGTMEPKGKSKQREVDVNIFG